MTDTTGSPSSQPQDPLKRILESMKDDEPIEVDGAAAAALYAQRRDDAAKAKDEREKELRRIRAKHPTNLVARMRELRQCGLIEFTDVASSSEETGVVYKYTEMNAYRIFDALFIGTEVGDVHFNTARSAIVDERGEVVNDIWSSRELMDAMQLCKLKASNGISSASVVKWLQTWAMSHRFNDISERVRARLCDVEHIEVAPLLDTYLIQALGLTDNAENRAFSKYWCLSLYARVMYPGSLAPISMAMFGSMDAGKSHFQRMICRELLCDEHAAPVTFQLHRENRDLARDIYGISIIATIPEMTGFVKSDLQKLKSILTESTDTFDHKYKSTNRMPRQFIFCLDGNRYAGLFRDDDDQDAQGNSRGERRWFPVFVGQLPGEAGMEGEVRWDQEFRVDFGPHFGDQLWAMMKVCEQWFECHGMDEYIALVHRTTEMVKEFSRREKAAGEGVVKDDALDEKFPIALYRAVRLYGWIGEIRTMDSEKVRGLCVSSAHVLSAYADLNKREITAKRVAMKIKMMPDAVVGRLGVKKEKLSGFCFIDDASFSDDGKFNNGHGARDEFCTLFCEKYLPWVSDPSEAWMTSAEVMRKRGGDGF